ncbi:MAG: hypothetical protein JSW08_00695 [archaeon]|nr:MAG: hypothetical protein JSW08_00695 [archaeon]
MVSHPIVFPQSRELKQLIESHGWTTYLIPDRTKPELDQIERQKPAETFEIGDHSYFFVPIPREGQTWRDAYAVTKGLGPSLQVDPSYDGLVDVYHGHPKAGRANEVLFTRMALDDKGITGIFSVPIPSYPDPSGALLRTDLLLPIFRENFRIVTMDEILAEKQRPQVMVVDDRHVDN